MNRLRRHGRVQLLAVAVIVAASATAGLIATPALADPARARAHFDLAKRYFEVDEYRKAIEEFKAAHVEESDPAFLYNIAECYRHMGETKEALVFYRRFLLLSPANAPARPSVEKRVAAMQAAMRDAADAAPTPAPGAAPTPGGSPAAQPAAGAHEPTPAAAPVALALAAPPPAVGPPPADLREQASPAMRTEASRPFYKSPWFYVVLGGALVAGTVGAFALASGKGSSPPSTPLGNQPTFQ